MKLNKLKLQAYSSCEQLFRKKRLFAGTACKLNKGVPGTQLSRVSTHSGTSLLMTQMPRVTQPWVNNLSPMLLEWTPISSSVHQARVGLETAGEESGQQHPVWGEEISVHISTGNSLNSYPVQGHWLHVTMHTEAKWLRIKLNSEYNTLAIVATIKCPTATMVRNTLTRHQRPKHAHHYSAFHLTVSI